MPQTGVPTPRPPRTPSDRLRWRTLAGLESRAEPIMAALGFVWVALFVLDMTRGLNALLVSLSTAIWTIFIADFSVRLLLAPDRGHYLRRNWLTALSLVIPALRVFRVAALIRVLAVSRAARGVRLVRAVTSLNRGMGALGATMRRRGVAYVLTLTLVVTLAGAAGMYALEPHGSGAAGFTGYGDALWWTAMIMTTLGSSYWPQTHEGRILAVLIAVYAIGVFGYLTAALASFFVGRDAATPSAPLAGAADIRALRAEIAALRRELRGGIAHTD